MRKILSFIFPALIYLYSPLAYGTTSSINPAIPALNSPLASSPIRNNFAAAYNDINSIYASALFSVPTPAPGALGGIFSFAPVSHFFVTGLNTSGAMQTAQPAFTDITGVAQLAQGGTGVTLAQGNGNKIQLSTGTTTTNDCVKFDLNGNAVDSGSPCGTGVGTVTSVTFTGDGVLLSSTPSSAVTSTGTLQAALNTQTKNTVLSGPATGSNTAPTFRALVGADLPNPASNALGGIQSIAQAAHNFITGISTSGVPSAAQPVCADLSDGAASCSTDATNATNIGSGTLPAARLPALTGDATSSAGSAATTVVRVNGATLGATTATSGNLLVGSGSAWVTQPISGDASLSSAGVLSLTARPGRLQVVGSHGGVYNSSWGNGASSRTDTQLQQRRFSVIGSQPVSQLRFAYAGYYLKNDGTGEHLFGNDFTATGAFEITSPANYFNAYAAGQLSVNVPNGIPLMLTDPLTDVDVPAGGTLWIRQMFQVASSQTDLFPSSSQTAVSTGALKETGFVAPSATSQISATGDLTTPSGGASFAGVLPVAVLGVPAAAMPGVCILGDSIADGTGDSVSQTTGALGFVARGLDGVNGFTVPYTKLTVGTDKLTQNTLATGWRKRALWPYCSHLIVQLGTNDVSSRTAVQIEGDLLNIWTAAKRTIGPYGKPMHVTQTLMMPKTTSTDSWATAANQTPVAGYEIGGIRDLVNAYIILQAGGGVLDDYVDPNSGVEDQAHLSKWISNGSANYCTSDGVHPSSACHILAAVPVNTWALGIKP